MHCVPTFHDCSIFQRVKQILITYGTMMPHGVLHTRVIIAQTYRIARSTLFAVEEVLTTTNSADTTVIAMELPLINIIVVEFALITKIFSHIDTTVCAEATDWLLRVTD